MPEAECFLTYMGILVIIGIAFICLPDFEKNHGSMLKLKGKLKKSQDLRSETLTETVPILI